MSKVWGTPTWNLLHCIPEKIDETYFNNNKDKVIMIINSILIGLPCPDCSSHSLKLFNKYKRYVVNKITLKKVIFLMHNDVNKKTKKKVQNISILEMYTNYNMKNVLEKWVDVYKPAKNIPKLMYNNMQINIVKKKIIKYFQLNLKYYDK
tara:strand:- start:6169 stop:6618 length:450 start_codon:yes stop_codon:yes gene_type:complete